MHYKVLYDVLCFFNMLLMRLNIFVVRIYTLEFVLDVLHDCTLMCPYACIQVPGYFSMLIRHPNRLAQPCLSIPPRPAKLRNQVQAGPFAGWPRTDQFAKLAAACQTLSRTVSSAQSIFRSGIIHGMSWSDLHYRRKCNVAAWPTISYHPDAQTAIGSPSVCTLIFGE